MASSNRHWPSMFKSKPCNSHHHHHQWQHHDTINSSSLLSTASCHRPTPFSSGPGCEERSPEPKPRWNPKPEQIRILEAIFNSGMVNPPRDEIRKIRAQLQEYGQVGDANVFYWFQNRKSRSKHKQRHLLQSSKQQQKTPTTSPHTTTTTAVASASINAPPPSSSSSSSSDKSSPKNASNTNKAFFSVGSSNVVDLLNSPTASVNQTFYNNIVPEPFFYPMQQQQSNNNNNNQGFSFSDLSNVVQQQNVGSGHGFLLSELMMNNHQGGVSKKVEDDDHEKMLKLHHQHQQQMSYTLTTTINNTTCVSPPPPPSSNVNVPLTINQIQGDQSGGVGTLGSAKSTVFINDVAFEVNAGPFNVRECFGDDAVLIHSSGHPVLTNEWGVTLQPLHHGAFYYLIFGCMQYYNITVA